ncbi:MAG: S9 family peptidase [Algoriphagus sp.]|uniref:S9 family peptidase n=1 Tax=Algoriphagus sp. TaxID=1872435 RepID=UPI0017A67DF1|nr:prolyl oligopeptidase family serine peptidase [Algoriphagus sp.]NVJ85468.1 S9 family peptidase [Algoriphagus sp.]
MKKIFFLAWTFLFLAFIGKSQNISEYLATPFPTDLTASPDGKSVAWVFNSEGERNIFFAKAPDFEARPLTTYIGDNGVGIGSLTFSPDGKSLVYVRGNSKNSAGEAANPAQLQENTDFKIHLIDLESGDERLLSEGSGPVFSPDSRMLIFRKGRDLHQLDLNSNEPSSKIFQARGSIGSYAFSPDGKWISFVSNRGDHSFIGLWNREKQSLHYPETSLDHDRYPAWSPDGTKLAYLRIPNVNNKLPFTSHKEANPWSIRVLNMDTMKAAEVWLADPGKGSVVVRDIPAESDRIWWTPNGSLVFPWEKNGWVQLYAFNPTNGQIQHLTKGQGFVEKVNTSYLGNELLLTSNIGDIERRKIYRLDLNSFELEDLSEKGNINWTPVRIENGFVFLSSTGTRPAWPMIRYYNQEKLLAEDLFPENFPKNLVTPIGLDIQASDGFKSRAQLFLPPNHDPNKQYPAVIFLHGGSRRQMLLGFNYSQYYSNAYALQQYFAANGFIALTLNYRSGIGYGLDFREEENYGAGGASEVLDLLAAADYLAARPDVDDEKIIPWGGSYGGFLTAHGLAQAPEKFLAGVDIHGVHNWNQEIPVFAPWYEPEKFPEMAALAFQSSSMAYVENWEDPVLLIHGDDDRNVLFSESVELAEILRKQGVSVEQLVFPDEVHSFILHRNWVKAYEAAIEFIQRQIQP